MTLEKYFTCKREELDKVFRNLNPEIGELSRYLVLIYQQLEGERTNITPGNVKGCYRNLSNIVFRLNEAFEDVLTQPNFEKEKKDLEKSLKRDIY